MIPVIHFEPEGKHIILVSAVYGAQRTNKLTERDPSPGIRQDIAALRGVYTKECSSCDSRDSKTRDSLKLYQVSLGLQAASVKALLTANSHDQPCPGIRRFNTSDPGW